MIRLIAAIDRRRGIAKNGAMPWHIPEDEAYFTRQTKTHGAAVLTGGTTFRDTYKNRPLADRQNYVLTHRDTPIPGAVVVHDLDALLREFTEKDLWVSGGAEIFAQVIAAGKADELYLTRIDAEFGCDKFFPEYEDAFTLAEESEVHEQNGFHFTYARYIPRGR